MNKAIIHFAHANGFPAGTYSKLFSYLAADFQVNYLDRHAHNPKFPVNNNWERLRDELREELEKRYTEKIIGVGHSLGGILHLLVAAEKPELYKAIILLDAPVISRLSSAGIKFLKKTNLMERMSLARMTRFRRSAWKNREDALAHFQQKENFQKFDKDVLRDYLEHAVIENETGVKLFFKPSIEAKIYKTLPDYLPKLRGRLKIPAAYIGGTFSKEARLARLGFMKKNFSFDFYFVEGSHLFPLEHPQKTAEVIKQAIEKIIIT
ncbi:MAG TPA: alpha/beta hydrolase [Pyrinomonadaceae bacterium]|nr:alpha/beta hydrolase [Pyrinomonadaceae bacterium]